VRVPLFIARGDGQTEAVPPREGRGTGSEMARLAAGGTVGDARTRRVRRADQGPPGTVLRVEDSPARGPGEASEAIAGSPGRTRR